MTMLSAEKVLLNAKVKDKREAIELAGQLLVKSDHVSAEYVAKMHEREEELSTWIGNGVAIPHGTADSKAYIHSTGISVVQIPDGVDFGNGNTAYLLFGIAAKGDDHLNILARLALLCSDEESVKKMVAFNNADALISFIGGDEA
ncbi:PTS sugar transporter subunit IIA [Staphylospora marina]|uniref:PTS sugar transporter subunit IIA n=1 Tax=Staphylospora marina TaxID=2490858 RepID=UPI0019D05E3F|nr:PTS sugar transporter subunit IIA [Staphylospora marina]